MVQVRVTPRKGSISQYNSTPFWRHGAGGAPRLDTDSTIEVVGYVEELQRQRNCHRSFDDSQMGELQFACHGVFGSSLGAEDF
jgi:hypothetical protein